jgi:hypothetical protein
VWAGFSDVGMAFEQAQRDGTGHGGRRLGR